MERGTEKFTPLLAAMACLALLATGPASASSHAYDLSLVGEGRMSWFGIDLYDASLWTSTGQYAPDTADIVVLAITYRKNVNEDRLLKVTRKEWKKLGLHRKATERGWYDQLAAVLPEIRSGDTLASRVGPDGATQFFYEDRETGTIDDAEFGQAFLAIWLDPRTRAKDLRRELLAGNELPAPQTRLAESGS